MAVIPVPKPSPKAMNPNRPVNALLLAQVEHLQHAERRLPLKYRTEIYTHAIRTEGEAALYIREVTEAIRKAHGDAEANRTNAKSRKPSPSSTAKRKGPSNKSQKRK